MESRNMFSDLIENTSLTKIEADGVSLVQCINIFHAFTISSNQSIAL